MQNPAMVAFKIADLPNLDAGNILSMSRDLGQTADMVLDATTPANVLRPEARI